MAVIQVDDGPVLERERRQLAEQLAALASRPRGSDGEPAAPWIINLRVSKMGGLLRSLRAVEIARRCGFPIVVGAQVAAGLDAVVDALSGRRSLLVIDNCEHVLESARRACDRLAGQTADLRLLVTSRIPLDVEPECVWRVPPMAVPGEADRPAMTEAVSLFFARAAMAGVTLRAGPAELGLASSICRQAGGLPLAIELAANGLRVASPTELAQGLGSSGWPARSAGRGRHDSLDACLTWSHALLSADAAVVFRRLSVFPSGFAFRCSVRKLSFPM